MKKEPEIFHAIKKGALVENVKFFQGTNKINFDDGSINGKNTRVSYPLNYTQQFFRTFYSVIRRKIFSS